MFIEKNDGWPYSNSCLQMSDNAERIGYKFSNILELSVTNDMGSLHEEWECVNYRSESSTQCICSRWIKHAYYYLNRINGNTIRVGSGCVKKLELPKKGEGRQSNQFILRFIQQWRGEYTNINDLLKYSEQSRNDILDIIEETIKYVPISKLEEFLDQVHEMRDIFHKNDIDCRRIQAICDRIVSEIRRHNEHLQFLEIQYQREMAAKRREEEQRKKNAEENRVALEKYNQQRKQIHRVDTVVQPKKRKEVDTRFLEVERKEEEERIRLKEEERLHHARGIQLSLNERNEIMAMIMGTSNTS
jgi:hypothetical protein